MKLYLIGTNDNTAEILTETEITDEINALLQYDGFLPFTVICKFEADQIQISDAVNKIIFLPKS